MLEDLAEYRLTFIKPMEEADVYELIARPVLVNRVRHLQQQDQLAEKFRSRLTWGEDMTELSFDAHQYLLFGGRPYVPDAIKDEIPRSSFEVHRGSINMYRDLMRLYKWPEMKRDFAR